MKHSDFHYSEHYSEIKRKLNSLYCTSFFLLFKENSVSSEIYLKKITEEREVGGCKEARKI